MAYRRTSYTRRAARVYSSGRLRRRSRRALLRPRRTTIRGRGSYTVTAPKTQARGRAFGRSLGEGVGGLLGSRFPALAGPASSALGWVGDKAGAWLGNKLGTIMGWGSYRISKNTVAEGTAVPYMHKSGQSAHIAHREFLGDVVAGPTANAFNVDYIDIQPANRRLAPWLSNLASQYQEYRIKGMMFHFVSTTATALVSGGGPQSSNNIGTIIMATSYNSGIAKPFPDKTTMENTQYTQSAKLSENMAHAIECDPRLMPYNLWYVRTGPVPAGQPIQMYDYAKFALATISPYPNTTLGELWVTYDIGLLKPIMRNGANVLSDVFQAVGPFNGATQYNLLGSADVTYNPENSIGGVFYGLAPNASAPNGATIYQFGPGCLGLTFQVTLTGQLVDPPGNPLPNIPQAPIPAFIGCDWKTNVVAVNNPYMFAPAGGNQQGQCVSLNVVATFVVHVTASQALINFTHTGFQSNAQGSSLQLLVSQVDTDVANSTASPGFRAADNQHPTGVLAENWNLDDPLIQPSNATSRMVPGLYDQ